MGPRSHSKEADFHSFCSFSAQVLRLFERSPTWPPPPSPAPSDWSRASRRPSPGLPPTSLQLLALISPGLSGKVRPPCRVRGPEGHQSLCSCCSLRAKALPRGCAQMFVE